MTADKVAESAAIRDGLLAQTSRRRAEFESAGDKAEKDRTLPNEAVATLRSLGIFWLKTPAELGGTPLEPLDFCDVMEELAYTDTATAWTAMVGNGGSGTAGGWLPDEGARAVFSTQRPRPLVVGTPGPRGAGRAVPGGYVVSGRWGFASGIAQADWVIGGFRVPGGSRVSGGSASGAGAGDSGAGDRFMVAIETEAVAGGRVLSLTSPMQRYLRDLLATRQHIGLSEENYERAGRFRIQMADTFHL